MITLSQCPGMTGTDPSALQAALDLKQPIAWDLPVTSVMGSDPTKGLFLPPGFDITFTPQGLLNVDSVGFPAMCAMNASGTIRGAKIHYTGITPLVTPSAAGRWTDVCARDYLVKTGMNPYTGRGGGTVWCGPTNTSALISIRGNSVVSLPGLKVYADPGVPATGLVITAVALDPAYALGEAMGLNAGAHAPYTFPSLEVSDVDFDGVMMGFVGRSAEASYTRVVSRRYGDLPDAAASWFAPPHLFYVHGKSTIRDVVDLGQYVGDPLARLSTSGSCLSLKVELGYGSLVDGYYSRRLHGGMDILADGVSDLGGVIKNAFFLIDTSIMTTDGKPAAWGLRTPSDPAAYRTMAIQAKIANRAGTIPPVLLPRGGMPNSILALDLLQGYTG